MNTLGDLEGLKREIEKSFHSDLEQFKQEQQQRFDQEIKELEEKAKKQRQDAERLAKDEQHRTYRSQLASLTMDAKKKFEKEREDLITDVFEKAQQQAKKVMSRKAYVDMVKKYIGKKKVDIIAQKGYEKEFPTATIEQIEGIVLKEGSTVIDFGYSSFIRSRAEELRHKVSEVLFS